MLNGFEKKAKEPSGEKKKRNNKKNSSGNSEEASRRFLPFSFRYILPKCDEFNHHHHGGKPNVVFRVPHFPLATSFGAQSTHSPSLSHIIHCPVREIRCLLVL